MAPRVSALIASYNTRDLLLEAVRSALHEPEVEVVVVDNASHDGSPEAVARQFPEVSLIRSPANLGFAAATNLAASSAHAPRLLVLNPDAALLPGALERLLGCLDAHPGAALVGPRLVYPDGRPQASAFRFPGLVQIALDLFPIPRLTDSALNGRLPATRGAIEIDHPLGACMLIERAAWEAIGPLDEGYFMYLEEVDWCRRARARGWQIWFEPAAVVVHHAGAATRQAADPMFAQLWRSRLRYYQRFHSPGYQLAVRWLVRLGLAHIAFHGPAGRAQAAASVLPLLG